jgi:hypothetical protein
MAHFTQLGVSANQDRNPEVKEKTLPNITSQGQRPRANEKKPGKQRTAALIASLIATALLGVFVLESGCSKESNKTATVASPTQTMSNQMPTPGLTAPASTFAPAVASQPPAKKKSRQRKLSASRYSNPAYGISFRYPKYDSLREGDEANQELDGLGPLEMNFVQPGGTTISAVELPRRLYSGTDFNSAFFNVSVNPTLTTAECEQFAFAATDDPEKDAATTSKTKVGATEFYAAKGFSEEENNRADVKYYHVFQNGSCYEFALGLETVAEDIPDEITPATKPTLKPVDRNEVFRQLNWILSTVKIQPIAVPDVPEKTVPEIAADTPTTSTNPAITEAH